ncbi:MAG TPA: hypothetical protein PLP21_01090 [Pyrinomonadaceae bacterium]|nr:hypothetical protein [Acidobacteriota bacterium]HQZ94877.1 hypothetical protein [Pyrinomonadaceae bacterium]
MIGKNSFLSRATALETNIPGMIFFPALVTVFVASVFAFQPTAAVSRGEVGPTATPSPRKIRNIAVGDVNGDGMDPGVRSAASSPAGTDRSRSIRKKNQDIEVENDETHRAGSPERRSTPRKTRTETVNNNESITRSVGSSRSGHASGNKRVRTSTGNKAPRTKVNRGRPATKRK